MNTPPVVVLQYIATRHGRPWSENEERALCRQARRWRDRGVPANDAIASLAFNNGRTPAAVYYVLARNGLVAGDLPWPAPAP